MSGLHHEDRPAVTTEHTRQRGEDRPVVGFETRTRDLALEHRELMAQHEDLGVLGPVPATAQHQQVDDKSDETVEAGHVLILIDATANQSDRNAKPQVTPPRRVLGTHRSSRANSA